MFTSKKQHLIWAICCTFMTGIIVGATANQLSNGEVDRGMIGFSVAIFIYVCLYWGVVYSIYKKP
jgi:hypothetical protein